MFTLAATPVQKLLPFHEAEVEWVVVFEGDGLGRHEVARARNDEAARLAARRYLAREWPGETLEHHIDCLIGFDFAVTWSRLADASVVVSNEGDV